MGHNIFVSYKYADNNVKNLPGQSDSTVRSYVDELERVLGYSSHNYMGEKNGEDLSGYNEDTIWEKLKDHIFPTTVTIVFISPNMKEDGKADKDQWIPWEIAYSLRETERNDRTSRSNAMLAVVLPDSSGSYTYYLEKRNCCGTACQTHHTDRLFYILRKNKFNYKKGDTYSCNNGNTIWTGTCSYIEAVRWADFITDVDKYVDHAYDRKDHIDDYNITKQVEP